MEGFSRGRKLDKVGQHEADTAELFFEDVRVPAENPLGELDRRIRHMMDHLPQERLRIAVVELAHAAGALAMTLEYVRERRPSAARSAPSSTAASCSPSSTPRSTSRRPSSTAASKATSRAADRGRRGEGEVVDAPRSRTGSSTRCVQLHGGYGYMDEYRGRARLGRRPGTKIWAGPTRS